MWSYVTPIFGALDRLGHWSRWNAVFSAVSAVAAEPIERIAGPEREVLVLPNGIDQADWAVDPPERDPDDVRIVTVMRLAPRKRPLHLLRMIDAPARRGRRRRSASGWTSSGEGPERPSLERYIRRHGLGDVVSLVGRRTRDEIRAMYGRADLFVAPANLESFGIAALEARCAGVPVVAKERTGIREFVEHGREGLLARSDARHGRPAAAPRRRSRAPAADRQAQPGDGRRRRVAAGRRAERRRLPGGDRPVRHAFGLIDELLARCSSSRSDSGRRAGPGDDAGQRRSRRPKTTAPPTASRK